MKKLIGVGVLATCLAACGPSGKLSGSVKVLGGDPSKVTVMLQGEVNRMAAVDSNGGYAFDGVPDGIYLIEAVGESTEEDRLTARAEVTHGTGEVNELVFQGVGRVSGRVTSPTGAAGAQVFVAGEAVRLNVAEDGSFVLPKVPAGEQTVVAVLDGYEPTYAKVSVPYHDEITNQVLALTEVAHGEGEITGRAYYFDRADHTGITVKVEGTHLSAQTDKDGNYTLRGAPLGYVTLVAEAPGYQPARAVNVLSAAGGSLRAPDLRVSLVEQRFAGAIYQLAPSPDSTRLLFSGIPEFDSSVWLYAIDLTGTSPAVPLMRLGLSSVPFTVYWRADGKRAAVRVASTGRLYAANLETGELTQLTERSYDTHIVLARERLFFLETSDNNSPVLRVWDFASGTNQSIEPVQLTPDCGGDWGPAPFTVSEDGKVAWFATPESGAVPREAHLWDGAVTTVSGTLTLDCLSWRAGTQLLGMQVQGATGLFNLTTGTPMTLVTAGPSAFVYPSILFTGNEQYAWFVDASVSPLQLKAVPIGGGPVTTLQTGGQITSTGPAYIAVQPGGDKLAFRAASGDLVVMRADGAQLASYQVTGSTAFWFGPQGKHLLFVESNRTVRIANTGDLQAKPFGETYFYQGMYSPVWFSPHEKAVAMMSHTPTNQYQFQLRRADDASVIDLPFVATGASAGFNFSGNDTYALVSDDAGDHLVTIDTGAVANLQRKANALGSYSAPVFTGDESRLLFGDSNYGTSLQVWSAHSEDGSLRLAVDSEPYAQWLVIPDSHRLAFVDNSASGEPRGLYTFVAP